jgi:hypothetical protein
MKPFRIVEALAERRKLGHKAAADCLMNERPLARYERPNQTGSFPPLAAAHRDRPPAAAMIAGP